MKKMQTLLAAAALTITGAAWAAGDHGAEHAHKPMHGGVVAEAKGMDVELVAKSNQIDLYVRDHGKPVRLEGASARLTLVNGSEKSEAQLKAVDDKLVAQGTFSVVSGTKVSAVITMVGKKPINVNFIVR
ncbi:MAG: hypothetical protein EPO12_21280 [Aquabacterium sp.]|nr:MAG: hypothetical protein EPO12_21280 [Aquabacterium sp.]